MDKIHYDEMVCSLENLISKKLLDGKNIYVFGHCNATEELIDLIEEKHYNVLAILDNNTEKHNSMYRDIKISLPETILEDEKNTVVLIATRAFEAMKLQLRNMGFIGDIYKLVEYNSYAEYSLSDDTLNRKYTRVTEGIEILGKYKQLYNDHLLVLCPFASLGDIYIMMSYLPHYLLENKIEKYKVLVVGNGCLNVVNLFDQNVGIALNQHEMDKLIQAALYTNEKNTFIAHQDRPYCVNLHKALYLKCITLEQMYCVGVFGLDKTTQPIKPCNFKEFAELDKIVEGKTVILSPYAKSVTALPTSLWNDIVDNYISEGYICFTNVFGDEKPLKNTMPISPSVLEMKSVIEKAGVFIGIRSGLCDVVKYANCKKIALYPTYNYSDTKWKAIDVYYLDGFENIEIVEGYKWKIN